MIHFSLGQIKSDILKWKLQPLGAFLNLEYTTSFSNKTKSFSKKRVIKLRPYICRGKLLLFREGKRAHRLVHGKVSGISLWKRYSKGSFVRFTVLCLQSRVLPLCSEDMIHIQLKLFRLDFWNRRKQNGIKQSPTW